MQLAIHRLFAPIVFVLAFVVNPAYFSGCTSEESEPSFGEAEMLQLLDAANDMGTWEIESAGKRYEIELVLIQATGDDVMAVTPQGSPFATAAYACGSRSFLQAAHACSTLTELVLEGTLTIRALDAGPVVEVASDLEVTGSMIAYGEDLRSAHIELAHGTMYGAVQLFSPDGRSFDLEQLNLDRVGASADFTIQYNANL